MEWITEALTSQFAMGAIAGAATWVLGLGIRRYPKKLAAVNTIAGETAEAIQAIAQAVADGKIQPAEAHAIFGECRDVYDAFRRLKDSEAAAK